MRQQLRVVRNVLVAVFLLSSPSAGFGSSSAHEIDCWYQESQTVGEVTVYCEQCDYVGICGESICQFWNCLIDWESDGFDDDDDNWGDASCNFDIMCHSV